MHTGKRIISFLLSLVLVLGCVPAAAAQGSAKEETKYFWPVINGSANSHGYNCNCDTHEGTHKGQDISGSPYGQAILSPVTGTVTSVRKGCRGRSNLKKGQSCTSDECSSGNITYFSKYKLSFCNGGSGNGVTVKDSKTGYTFSVAHMAYDPVVKKGDKVVQGQVLGFVGETGCSAGVHLHLAVKNNKGNNVNPMKLTYVKPKSTPSTEKLAINSVRYPKNKKSGEAFSVSGTVSSDQKIKTVKISVTDSNSKVIFSASTSPNTYYYDLNSLNAKATFASIKTAGTYTYKIEATDAGKASVTLSKSFKVSSGGTTFAYASAKSSKCAAPTSQQTNFEGGVFLLLKTNTSGATIRYTLDGTPPGANSAAFSASSPIKLTSTKTVKAVAVKSGMTMSDVYTVTVNVNKAQTPAANAEAQTNGYMVTLACATKNASIYYTTDGSTPTAGSIRYTGSFTADGGETIKAVAVAAGMAFSDVYTYTVPAKAPPATPALRLETPADIGIGDTVRLGWNAVPNTREYDVLVRPAAGEAYTVTTGGAVHALALNAPDTYTFTVRAVNSFGESDESAPVTVTVHPNVTVTFADHDGTPIETQSVVYGGSAIPPAAPSRVGHTFTGWNGVYTKVTHDVTVTAEYVPEQYKITFLDADGNVLISRNVNYGEAFDPALIPVLTPATGYKFVAWVVRSGAGDSYEFVTGDAVFEPAFAWANERMPLAAAPVKAERRSDSSGYAVTVKLTNGTNADVEGKLVCVIKTSYDQLLATEITPITVPADAVGLEQTVNVACKDVGKLAEVYVVANDKEHADRTGGAYCETVSMEVTKAEASVYSYWSDWSDWQTEKVTDSDTRETETKTQYTYREKEYTTSTNPTLDGWQQYSSSVSYGSWAAWSGWSLTSRAKSDTRDVETRTVYYYFHYCDGNKNIAPSTKYTYGKYGPHELYSTTKLKVDRTSSTGFSIVDGEQKCAKGCGSYYYGGTKTQYRYRDRTKTTTYTFWRWGNWSAFGDTPVNATDNRQVQTRTVYRYRDLITETGSTSTTDIGAEKEKTGEEYRVTGALTNVNEVYDGVQATVMVYKEKNTDPTERQMEYVTQIVLGSGNSYDFTFLPKEPISAGTGDYIVAFGIAGADKLVNNAEKIEAPKAVYDVTFKSYDGTVIETQQVPEGENAEAPALTPPEGYDYRWNRTFTNITKSTEIEAVLQTKAYTVIFVDWANSEIVKIDTNVPYGAALEFPADRTAEGKRFIGWSLPEGSAVTDTLVIEAMYEDLTYTVTFANRDGSIFSTQEVPYGRNAELPEETPEAEGYAFIGWNSATPWWNVKADRIVQPLFVFENTADAPVLLPEEDNSLLSAGFSLATTTPEAQIRYTLNGAEPTETDALFAPDAEALVFTESTVLKAKAFCKGMNPSPVAELAVNLLPADQTPKVTALTDAKHFAVGEASATIGMRLDNPAGCRVLSYGYSIYPDTEDVIDFTATAGADALTGGKSFTVTELEPNVYTCTFFAELAGVGYIESDSFTFEIEASASPAIDAAAAKEQGGFVYVAEGLTGEALLALADSGATLTKEDGSAAELTKAPGSGAVLTKGDGTRLTVILKGDADGDGKVTTADARHALRMAIGLDPAEGWRKYACLIVSKDKVATGDARAILRAAIGLDKLALI